MARPRHPLALLLLLPGLLAAAGADDAQAAYEPTSLATHVLRDCALDLPTAACCAPVLASVDLGGGVPYLLHVAARPEVALAGLNASHLIAVYDVCGGLGNGGAQLAARRLRDVHLADRRVGDARALYNDESGTPTSPLTDVPFVVVGIPV
nr:unnamed protein product [Digitaria exilis]